MLVKDNLCVGKGYKKYILIKKIIFFIFIFCTINAANVILNWKIKEKILNLIKHEIK